MKRIDFVLRPASPPQIDNQIDRQMRAHLNYFSRDGKFFRRGTQLKLFADSLHHNKSTI